VPADIYSIFQEDYSAGMVRDVAPHLIPNDGAYDIQNGLLNEDGSIYRRGGSVNFSAAAFGTNITFLWDGYTKAGRRTLFANTADFGVLDTNDSSIVNLGPVGVTGPKGAAYLKGLLFIGGGHIYGGSRKVGPYTTGTVTATLNSPTLTGAGTTWTTNVDAGSIIQMGATNGQGTERVYVVKSVNSDTSITLTGNYGGTTGGGKSYRSIGIWPIHVNNPYPISEAYCVAANRLVAIDPANDQGIVFSEINAPHDYTNSVGTSNAHDFPEGNAVLALASVGGNLLVFSTGGVWAVTGMALDIVDTDGAPNHRKEMLSRDLIFWGPNGAITTWEQLLIVPTTSGVYLMDGTSTPILLSQPIAPLYNFYVERSYRPGQLATYRNHLFVPILSAPTGNADEFLVCRLSVKALDRRRRQTFAWTHFRGSLPAVMAVRPATGTVLQKLLGGTGDSTARIIDCTHYFEPESVYKNDANGSAHEFAVITRDHETGNQTLNVVRKLVTRYVLEDAASDNPELEMAWTDGTENVSGAKWGENNWNAFTWGPSLGAYLVISPNAPEDRGINPWHQRVNQRTRYIRVRIRNTLTTANLILRSQEFRIRPSRATRR
jgi:hypothetical protein